MTSFWGPGMPDEAEPTGHDSHEHAMWDAAYVLGSLSTTDRREFEEHLRDCLSCREGVAELSGMPALLSQLDRNELAAVNRTDVAPSLPAEVLPSLLAKVAWRRRRSRMMTSTATAAAVLAIGVLVGVQGNSPTPVPTPPQASAPSIFTAPRASAPARVMTQVGTNALASTVSLSDQSWGTYIVMKCVCLAPVNAHHDTLAMVVVGRDGSQTQLATWVANPGHTATPGASISTPVDQIAAVQVVSADTGDVLLQRTL